MSSLCRRDFLSLAASLTASSFGGSRAARGEQPLDGSLATSPLEPVRRVRVQLEVNGNIDIPRNALVSKERSRRVPMEATSVIDYEEQGTRDAQGRTAAARRYYYEAESRGKVAGAPLARTLRPSCRRVLAQLEGTRTLLCGQREHLTHSELELLRMPAGSLRIDSLWPRDPLTQGHGWDVEHDALACLLDLAAIQQSDVRGEVVEIDAKTAKLQLRGKIAGSVEGVPTSIDLGAKATIDRALGEITWLALAIHEKREIGKAVPGFEVGATIKLVRQRLREPNAIRDTEPLALRPLTPEQRLVDIRSSHGAFSTLVDRSWRVMSDAPGLTSLRMIESDRSIAQCDIRPLAPLAAGEQLTLEAFQAEIRKSLGSRFVEFIEAGQQPTSAGLLSLRVVVQGMVEEVPVQWVFLHFGDDHGRRLSANFTLAAEQADRFGAADIQLVSSLRFLEPEETAPAEEAGESRAANVAPPSASSPR